MRIYYWFKQQLVARRLWDVFTYLFFGALATVVNLVSFAIARQGFDLSWPISNSISWLASVLFAFVTNKLWVFHSKTETIGALVWEFAKFMAARIVSYGLDMLCMYLLIDVVATGDVIAKIVTQVVVVIVNYAFSKLFIFTHAKSEEEI